MKPKAPPMNDAQKSAVRAYLIAKAYEATVREIVEPIHAEALRVWKPVVVKETRASANGQPITKYSQLYLADDKVAADIYADVEAMIAKRHPAIAPKESGRCPLLIAEHVTVAAERIVVDVFQDYGPMKGLGLTFNRLLCAGVGKLKEFVDLNVKLAIALYPREFTSAKVLA